MLALGRACLFVKEVMHWIETLDEDRSWRCGEYAGVSECHRLVYLLRRFWNLRNDSLLANSCSCLLLSVGCVEPLRILFRAFPSSATQSPYSGPNCASSFFLRRSIKAEVKKKHLPLRLEFFLLRSPLERTRSVLTCRGMSSVAGRCGPQRFSSLVRDEAHQFRNQQSRTVVRWRP